MVKRLEQRAVDGYQDITDQLVGKLDLSPGETILDVGCGTGAHDRYILNMTQGINIVGVDHSNYLINEAQAIAKSEGIESGLEFRKGDATKLPLDDDGFDAVFSITVMEEVNADRMISEMIRVAKPGGRVGVVIRAVDLPWIINVPLPPELKSKIQAPNVMGSGVGEDGCADSSIYSRMMRAGLRDLQMFPQFITFPGRQNWESQARSVLADQEREIWDQAVQRSRIEGTFFISEPFHCAVGKKPNR